MTEISLNDIFREARHVIALAQAGGIKIATAESCTGGLIGAAITAISGSSAVFKGGIIAYDNQVKMDQLGVSSHLINDDGAVSASVAKSMAAGALDRLDVDLAVSVTGIAGPTGGSDDKPVGTVYLGIAQKSAQLISTQSHHFNFGNIGRNKIRDASCYEALRLLANALR